MTPATIRVESLLLAASLALACGSTQPGETDTAGDTTASTLSATGTDATSGTDTTGGGTSGTGTLGGTDSTGTTAEPTTSPTEPTTSPTDATTSTSTGDTTDGDATTDDTTTGSNPLWDAPNLWYSVDDALIYIEIDPADGSVIKLVHNQLAPDAALQHGQNGLTMLEDGSLLGSREAESGTQIFHVAAPPTTENTPAMATVLGVVPNDGPGAPLRIEALYTDCDGRVYLMDTGSDVSSSDNNRLLRFTGDYLGGDLAFEVLTDLENASVGDIDDMSPGIVDGEVSDSLGFAMDSGTLWQIDYTTGTGNDLAGTDGSWGIHALGGPLFDDMQPRLYILSSGDGDQGAELMQVSLDDYEDSQPLIVGPDLDLDGGYNGWSGLAGPLTECMTTIPG